MQKLLILNDFSNKLKKIVIWRCNLPNKIGQNKLKLYLIINILVIMVACVAANQNLIFSLYIVNLEVDPGYTKKRKYIVS